jgi:hypothetical protein
MSYQRLCLRILGFNVASVRLDGIGSSEVALAYRTGGGSNPKVQPLTINRNDIARHRVISRNVAMISLRVEGRRNRRRTARKTDQNATNFLRSRFSTVAQERNPLHVRRINQCTCASYMKLAVDTRVAAKGLVSGIEYHQ